MNFFAQIMRPALSYLYRCGDIHCLKTMNARGGNWNFKGIRGGYYASSKGGNQNEKNLFTLETGCILVIKGTCPGASLQICFYYSI